MLYLRPSDIRYCQDSIAAFFSDGLALQDRLLDLIQTGCRVQDCHLLRVVYHQGLYWTINNRSLWVYKELEKLGVCEKIKARLVFMREETWLRHFTTKSRGQKIRIRGGRLSCSIRNENNIEWKSLPPTERRKGPEKRRLYREPRYSVDEPTPEYPQAPSGEQVLYRKVVIVKKTRQCQRPPQSDEVPELSPQQDSGCWSTDSCINGLQRQQACSSYYTGQTWTRCEDSLPLSVKEESPKQHQDIEEERRVFFSSDKKAWAEFLSLADDWGVKDQQFGACRAWSPNISSSPKLARQRKHHRKHKHHSKKMHKRGKHRENGNDPLLHSQEDCASADVNQCESEKSMEIEDCLRKLRKASHEAAESSQSVTTGVLASTDGGMSKAVVAQHYPECDGTRVTYPSTSAAAHVMSAPTEEKSATLSQRPGHSYCLSDTELLPKPRNIKAAVRRFKASRLYQTSPDDSGMASCSSEIVRPSKARRRLFMDMSEKDCQSDTALTVPQCNAITTTSGRKRKYPKHQQDNLSCSETVLCQALFQSLEMKSKDHPSHQTDSKDSCAGETLPNCIDKYPCKPPAQRKRTTRRKKAAGSPSSLKVKINRKHKLHSKKMCKRGKLRESVNDSWEDCASADVNQSKMSMEIEDRLRKLRKANPLDHPSHQTDSKDSCAGKALPKSVDKNLYKPLTQRKRAARQKKAAGSPSSPKVKKRSSRQRTAVTTLPNLKSSTGAINMKASRPRQKAKATAPKKFLKTTTGQPVDGKQGNEFQTFPITSVCTQRKSLDQCNWSGEGGSLPGIDNQPQGQASCQQECTSRHVSNQSEPGQGSAGDRSDGSKANESQMDSLSESDVTDDRGSLSYYDCYDLSTGSSGIYQSSTPNNTTMCHYPLPDTAMIYHNPTSDSSATWCNPIPDSSSVYQMSDTSATLYNSTSYTSAAWYSQMPDTSPICHNHIPGTSAICNNSTPEAALTVHNPAPHSSSIYYNPTPDMSETWYNPLPDCTVMGYSPLTDNSPVYQSQDPELLRWTGAAENTDQFQSVGSNCTIYKDQRQLGFYQDKLLCSRRENSQNPLTAMTPVPVCQNLVVANIRTMYQNLLPGNTLSPGQPTPCHSEGPAQEVQVYHSYQAAATCQNPMSSSECELHQNPLPSVESLLRPCPNTSSETLVYQNPISSCQSPVVYQNPISSCQSPVVYQNPISSCQTPVANLQITPWLSTHWNGPRPAEHCLPFSNSVVRLPYKP